MLHAPISQIMSTSFSQWQTTSFSVFSRPSRVEVNPQKDLEDMLSKLDETSSSSEVAKPVQRKLFANKQKFLELALPCGILALLSLIYSLIYLVDAGEGIVNSIKTRDYLKQLVTLDSCLATILHEHSERITLTTRERSEWMSKGYDRTDEALLEVLTTKNLAEWKLISKITDWRNRQTRDVIDESDFYLEFNSELKAVVFEKGFKLKELRKWKAFYEYLNTMRDAFEVDILLNILRLAETNSLGFNLATNVEKTISFAAKFKKVLCEVDRYSDTRRLSCSYALFCNLIKNSMNFSMIDACWDNSTEYDSNKLKHLRTHIQGKKISLLGEIKRSTSKTLTISAILFCMLFVFIGATATCISIFVYIFREQTQVALVVSDMLKGVTSRVNKQRESTDQVVNRVRRHDITGSYGTPGLSDVISCSSIMLTCGINFLKCVLFCQCAVLSCLLTILTCQINMPLCKHTVLTC